MTKDKMRSNVMNDESDYSLIIIIIIIILFI